MAHRIMSVDDSEEAQDYIRAALSDIGYDDLVSYQDPVRALEELTAGSVNPDLLLVDVMMPGIDGVELCARIRGLEDFTDTPIIMLTSRSDMDTLSHAFLAGANDYVTKPFNRIELQARMRSCLRLKAELERRRAGPDHRRQGRASVAEMTEILNSRAGFQAALQALPPEAQGRLGLAVFRVTGLAEGSDLTRAERSDAYRRIGALLGAVPLEARNLFCHWDKDLFCLAMPDATEDSLRRTAQRFVDAVSAETLSYRESWAHLPLTLHATLVLPGDVPPGTALGRGIAAAEAPVDPAGPAIRIAPTDRTGD